ncbi:MAG: hypothetical protein LBG47_07960 [Prevotellaceae bacterium]|jgi:hypothetical protein|nr:hypothetical protein [Prevotellaceae bacterium]
MKFGNYTQTDKIFPRKILGEKEYFWRYNHPNYSRISPSCRICSRLLRRTSLRQKGDFEDAADADMRYPLFCRMACICSDDSFVKLAMYSAEKPFSAMLRTTSAMPLAIPLCSPLSSPLLSPIAIPLFSPMAIPRF